MDNIILRLEHSNQIQVSNEDCKIQKILSTISPLSFAKLLKVADNKVNPRIATINKITKNIQETLENSPELYWFKSKGLLISTEECDILERNRIKISFNEPEHEGIMDGGHNAFAIAIFIIEKLFDKKIKTWEECKEFWREKYEVIIKHLENDTNSFNFSIPVEIIFPNKEDGAIEEFYDYISDICSARNNNVQLKETAKGNKVGYYDYLKDNIDKRLDVSWKTGDAGVIKSEDIISFASLGLIFLKDKGLLPDDVKSLNKISIYSQKSKCVDFFNDVISNQAISDENNGKYVLVSKRVMSALNLTSDIVKFFDRMFVEFPKLYHKAAPGKFGRISSVDNNKKGKPPYGTIKSLADYNYSYGFFYPLICGLTELMQYDVDNDAVSWRINPKNLDLSLLDLSQYVELIKMINFDPQKIGKGIGFYNESENVFGKMK